MSLVVLDPNGIGDVAAAIEAIDYAVAHGAQVLNMSWGTDESSRLLADAIRRASWSEVVVVCPAGNGQKAYGNPLGIIGTGKRHSFFSNGKTFWPGDPKANECVWLLNNSKK